MLPVTPDPELQAVISATIVSNLDGEGLSDLAKFGRKSCSPWVQQSQLTTKSKSSKSKLRQWRINRLMQNPTHAEDG